LRRELGQDVDGGLEQISGTPSPFFNFRRDRLGAEVSDGAPSIASEASAIPSTAVRIWSAGLDPHTSIPAGTGRAVVTSDLRPPPRAAVDRVAHLPDERLPT
jgi:hypothetical protein